MLQAGASDLLLDRHGILTISDQLFYGSPGATERIGGSPPNPGHGRSTDRQWLEAMVIGFVGRRGRSCASGKAYHPARRNPRCQQTVAAGRLGPGPTPKKVIAAIGCSGAQMISSGHPGRDEWPVEKP